MLLLTGLTVNMSGQSLDRAEEILKKYDLMGITMVTVSDGQITGSYQCGLRDLTAGLAVNDSTQFRIASISKLVMTTAMMKLCDEGRLDLDADVSTYLGYLLRNPLFPETPVTVRMLLSHTSSMNDGKGYDSFLTDSYNNVSNPPSFSDLMVTGGKYYTADMWSSWAPGKGFIYCNANFGLAATVIERITGMRFDDYVNKVLFGPMKVCGSYTVEGLSSVANLGVIYRNVSGKWLPQSDDFGGQLSSPRDFSGYKPGTNAAVFSPQGGLRISPSELAKIMMLQLDGGLYEGQRIISRKSIRLMQTPQWDGMKNGGSSPVIWGLSEKIMKADRYPGLTGKSKIIMGHSGEAYGLVSGFFFDPLKHCGFIFMVNGTPDAPAPGDYEGLYDFEQELFILGRDCALQNRNGD